MSLWAVVPVKALGEAKQRLASVLPPWLRQALMLAMLEDVLDALAEAPALGGVLVVTVDPRVSEIAERRHLRVSTAEADRGHTAAVAGAQRLLASEGRAGMLTLPADIPLVTGAEIRALLAAHGAERGFTIAPSRDERGSNAVLCLPPDAVPLRFGEDSFRPHLAAARAAGFTPEVLRFPGIALDIDGPEDLAAFLHAPGDTRAGRLLQRDHVGAGGEG